MRRILAILFFCLIGGAFQAAVDSSFDSTVSITRDNHPKMSSAIYDLVESNKAGLTASADNARVQALAHARVRVFLRLAQGAQGIPKGYGIESVSQNNEVVEAWVPIDRLEEIAALSEIAFVDEPQNQVSSLPPIGPAREYPLDALLVLFFALILAIALFLVYSKKNHAHAPLGKKH